jgi:uncharacterized metal-binding protein YceD (DUF177 family)
MDNERKTSRDDGLFIVDVDGLKRGPTTFDCDIPLSWLAAELKSCEYTVEPVRARLDAVVSLADSGVLVRGEAAARVRTECGTCLAEIHLDLIAPLSAFLMPRPMGAEDLDAELTPEDLEREWYDGDRFALDGLVRDGIMLELPMTPRCEGACRGEALVHLARKKEKIDPRLAPLANIRLAKEK